jgi:aspartate racemase
MSSKFSKTIGILGGVGPAASSYALQRLISICQEDYGAEKDTDFPNTVLTSFPIREMTELGYEHTMTNDESVVDQLNRGYATLAAAGAEVVYTACNTLSLSTNVFRELGIEHISIIGVTAEHLAAEHNGKSVAVISSSATRKDGLYAKELVRRGLSFVEVDDQTQMQVDEVILGGMSGKNPKRTRELLSQICNDLLSHVNIVVLGCTELSLVADLKYVNDDIIDAQEVTLRLLLKESK